MASEEDSLLVGINHELVKALESEPRAPVVLDAQVITVGQLFKALDEAANRLHRPRTAHPSSAVLLCRELKQVLTEQLTKETS